MYPQHFRWTLKTAREAWLSEAASDAQRQARDQSDMLRHADDAGRVVDFHALRHTFITRRVNSGATVKVVQELASHSTPTLTIGRYTHVRLHDLSAALDALPGPPPKQPLDDAAALRATGTDYSDVTLSGQRQQIRQQSARETVQQRATQCERRAVHGAYDDNARDVPNPLQSEELRNDVQRDATSCANAGGGTRTHTRGEPERILNPSRLPIPPHRQDLENIQDAVHSQHAQETHGAPGSPCTLL